MHTQAKGKGTALAVPFPCGYLSSLSIMCIMSHTSRINPYHIRNVPKSTAAPPFF